MQATLNRTHCQRPPCTCEACFGEHLRKVDFERADCAVSVALDRRPVIVFKILDRDGSLKTLVVNPENRSQAQTSWRQMWEVQSGPVI